MLLLLLYSKMSEENASVKRSNNSDPLPWKSKITKFELVLRASGLDMIVKIVAKI